ncbi:dihydrouridine synthase [Spathaspora passalidarum NRRL Y-27907]|uniref:tRNA-dihydrouridine synthase n=1 Tax=Spathaspora passalidarum (strain NRRL Y-27907 / 11-Y1) TaxID=619300 RepID=G3AND8_SPAPN|nr:dihydrouridine synthase [Spathaspora passalidarum NRRL Y-27907]EGW31927.1 dihydrouridine synthase [Spathaspora passalidarum NRRL Y-27907]
MTTSERVPRDPKYQPLNVIKAAKSENRPVYIAGPMVRYSKLPFRELVRHYKCDIVYTPMILAREFVRNEIARYSDFTTNSRDRCVIVQVGVNNVEDMLKFVAMIHPFVDGIGINCGCPIKEQVREGIGAALMSEPNLVADMVRAVKEKYGNTVCIDTKIRIHPDINETISFVDKVVDAGVDFITVHGRTKNTRSSVPVNLDAIKAIRNHVPANIPVIANGDGFSLADCHRIAKYTGVDGVMSARGVLKNPALFAGYEKAPWGAIEMFMHLCTAYGLPFRVAQHHFSEMLEDIIPRQYVKEMNETTCMIDLIDWFDRYFVLKRKGEDGFATGVEPVWHLDKLEGLQL